MRRLISLPILVALASTPAQAQWSTDSLSIYRNGMAAVSVGGMALFAGGGTLPNTPSDVVDIFHSASGTWTFATLSVAREYASATAVGPLALIAGGYTVPPGASDRVDVFDSVSGIWSTASLSQARFFMAATTVGTKAFFAGGYNLAALSNVVDIYDASIGPPGNPAAWSTATLTQPRLQLAAASVGNRALFAGGRDSGSTYYATVDIYDDSTGLWSTSALSQARRLAAGSSVTFGTRAYFAGGEAGLPVGMSPVIDVYDAQTSGWSVLTLALPRNLLAATAAGDRLLFAGGITNAFGSTELVEVLDANTSTWLAPMHLSDPRQDVSACTVGNSALFAGGYDPLLGASAVVDHFDFLTATDMCQAGAGSVLACPCSNPPANAPRGCDNSSGTGGAQLTSIGSPSLAFDSVVFTTNGERPTATSIVLQGSTHSTNGVVYGQGVRCMAGALRRLYVKTASGGSIVAPGPGDPSVSARSAALGNPIGAGQSRWYAVFYRDPFVLGGCAATSTFNVTQTQRVHWGS